MTVKYWIYRGFRGGGMATRLKGIIYDNLAEAEAFVEEQGALYPHAEHSIIKKIYGEDKQ